MSSILIIQRVLPHYRVPFFKKLFEKLGERGHELNLVYGQERPGTVPKTVDIDVSWARKIRNRYLLNERMELVWQPYPAEIGDADLIIVEQANRLLLNYVLLFRRMFSSTPLALWGHGKNMQGDSSKRLRERWKRLLMPKIDWWFAYTDISRKILESSGVKEDRITVVDNAVDVEVLSNDLEAVTVADCEAICASLGIREGSICLYCGGMYADKKLEFLLGACQQIKRKRPEFEMIFIGDGPEDGIVKDASERYEWIHYVGPQFGAAKACYFAISEAMLMPGLVGLAIVDSFISRTPLFTTDITIHSPEIAYLNDGENGAISPHSVEAYAERVSEYLGDQELQKRLRNGCGESATRYTLNNMVDRYVNGIERCLSTRETRL